MIDKVRILEVVLERLQNLQCGHYLELRTYKRNRALFIVRISQDEFLVIENGYEKNRWVLKQDKLEKQLKVLLRREFPRSNKVRLYNMGLFSEETVGDIGRKII